MPNSPMEASASPDPGADIMLFRHSKRQQWGVAALLWERDGKRGYQFSDGNLRIFRQGFYHLFESAAPPGDGSAKAVRRLARLARADALTEAARLPTLRDQLLLFRRSYPDGFGGQAWRRKHRGVGARKRLKRHRDPTLREARQLGPEPLAALIAGFAWPEVHARLTRMLTGTDLVPAAQLAKLAEVPPSRELSLALRDWIVAATGVSEQPRSAIDAGAEEPDAELERRFNHLVRLLGPAGTWPLVSALAGLLAPDAHTCVRPSVYETQGKMLVPNFAAKQRPRYACYVQYSQVAKVVFDELAAADLGPTDLLDVHDFIWETLRPAAREALTHQYELPPPPALEVDLRERAA